MRTQMLIRIHVTSEKCYSKAIKVAAGVTGVQSVTIAGEDKNLLLVIGVGIDSNRLTEKLRRKVGPAEVVELRTIDHHQDGSNHHGGHHQPYRYHPNQSLYKHEAARDLHYYTGGYQNAAGAYGQDYYGYGGGGYQQGQYKQHDYFYPAGNTHTVVHHGHNGYSDDSCSIM
ncbi:disease resistance protein RGA5 [Lolium perenne]|uniref:disease resistance protein RGA5 n=1 Tax=Lolium perenne TaxID=4522 RepID=UPI0021F5A4A6|nr:disease resistance protein RGA5-like [Lolium perenne]